MSLRSLLLVALVGCSAENVSNTKPDDGAPRSRDPAADAGDEASGGTDTAAGDTSAGTGTDTLSDTASALPDGLQVVLTWADDGEDFDLHLKDASDVFFAVPLDACFCNPNPDWAVEGYPDDDPKLELDDMAGYGPEVASIVAPAAGTYFIGVHDFDGDGGTPVDATVETWVFGTLVSTDVLALTRNQEWLVGSVEFPAGTFSVAPAVARTATLRTCE